MADVEYTLTNFEQATIEDFVDKRLSQRSGMSVYFRRGHCNIDKIEADIRNGASAELASYNLLKDRFKSVEVSVPDFEIYEIKEKSFEADVKVGNFGVHIKSVTKADQNKRGASWLFQVEDELFKEDSNELIVVCITDYPNVVIQGLYKVSDIASEGIIADPLMEKYKGIKQALYLKDLTKVKNYL